MQAQTFRGQPYALDAPVSRVADGFHKALLFQPGSKACHSGLRCAEALLQRLEGQCVLLGMRQVDQYPVLLQGEVEALQVGIGFLLQRVVDALDEPAVTGNGLFHGGPPFCIFRRILYQNNRMVSIACD